MKKHVFIIILLFFGFLYTAIAKEGDSWANENLSDQEKRDRLENINKEVETLSRPGNYSEAINIIKESLQLMKELYGENSSIYGRRLAALGMAYARSKRYDEAEDALENSLRIGQSNPGEYNQAMYAATYRFLAFTKYNLNKYQDARKYAYMALAIYKDSGREDTPEAIEMKQFLDSNIYKDSRAEITEKGKKITENASVQRGAEVGSSAGEKTERPSVSPFSRVATSLRDADKIAVKKIALIITIIFLLIIIVISIYNTYAGTTIFFSSYYDLIGSLVIPVIIYFAGIYILNVLKIKSEKTSLGLFYCCAVGTILYHYIKALIENAENKLLALCVGTSRFVLGYLIIVLAIAAAILAGNAKRDEESDAVYAVRRAGETALRAAIIGALMWFMHSLVGRRTYQKELYSKEEVQTILEEYRQRLEAQKQDNYAAEKEAMDPHRVLGVENGATVGEIKKAWRELCFQYHPDKTKGLGSDIQDFANERMQEINKAYEILSKDLEDEDSDISQGRQEKQSKKYGNAKDIKKCPFCAEEIQINDMKCRHCGELLGKGGAL